MFDVSKDIMARSDQLNADDLTGGPITVEITGIKRRKDDSKIAVEIAKSGHKPWMPCKTMLRVLTYAWGSDAEVWIGRSVTIFREPTVVFGGEEVGGIRISAMSHIANPLALNLQASKKSKTMQRVERLITPEQKPATDQRPTPPDSLTLLRNAGAAATKRGWTREQVTAILGGPAANTAEEDRPNLIERLNGAPPVDQNEGGEE